MTHAIHFETSDGKKWLGRLDGSTITTAGSAPKEGFIPDEAGWKSIEAASGATFEISDVHVLAPVIPPKILAVGLNYMGHVEETNLAKPDVPFMFAKFSTSVTGPFDPIVIPHEETRTDYEGEMGIIISKKAYRVSAEDAWDYVGGITALNDVSGRRAQLETPMRQFTLGKSFDTFTPMGPVIASVDSLANKDDVRVTTVLSGEQMQNDTTKRLIFTVAELVSYFTKGLTLEPGDMICTGTPGGVGDERKPPRYLVPGDIAEVTVEGVGTLRNPVEAEK